MNGTLTETSTGMTGSLVGCTVPAGPQGGVVASLLIYEAVGQTPVTGPERRRPARLLKWYRYTAELTRRIAERHRQLA